MLQPGQMLKNYLAGQRIRYFNPFTFCLIIAGMNAYLLQKLHWQGLFIDIGMLSRNAINEEIWNSSIRHFAFRLLLSVPVFSIVTFLFYYKSRYNFTEHLIANTYLRGEFWLFMILIELFDFFVHSQYVSVAVKLVLIIATLFYLGWSYAGLFEKRQLTKGALLKGFLVSLFALFMEMGIMNLIILKRFY